MATKIKALKKPVKVQCGWCRKYFIIKDLKGKHGYETLVCCFCGRTVNSSIKESTGKSVGRKHVHRDLKDGDIV